MIYFCLGDSITSDECVGIGTLVGQRLGAGTIVNFAHGNATASDWFDGKKRLTGLNPDLPPDRWIPENTLFNQITRVLSETAEKGSPVVWEYAGEPGPFRLDGLTGRGTVGNPDVIYIAIGTNDGRSRETAFPFDADRVLGMKYGDLDRRGLCSALRWGIETLQCVFPFARIFVATPLRASLDNELRYDWLGDNSAFSPETQDKKAEAIRKVAGFCACPVIDTYARSGVSRQIIKRFGDEIGVHPYGTLKEKLADYIAKEMVCLL
ncbi:MAG: SGNH/GDSL hydrolase family protein [Clostridia bacterium]|nr:SGNH/GDSL hydrolase family protein [Clostridia bacterium]